MNATESILNIPDSACQNWEAYIEHYIDSFCADMIEIVKVNNYIKLLSETTRIQFEFETDHLKYLRGIQFGSVHSEVEIPFRGYNGEGTKFIPFCPTNLTRVEFFLCIPIIKGWEQRYAILDGKHVCTEVYSNTSISTGPIYKTQRNISAFKWLKGILKGTIKYESDFFFGVLELVHTSNQAKREKTVLNQQIRR